MSRGQKISLNPEVYPFQYMDQEGQEKKRTKKANYETLMRTHRLNICTRIAEQETRKIS